MELVRNSDPLILRQFFQHLCCVVVLGIQFYRFFVIPDRQVLVALIRVRFTQTVVGIRRVWMEFNIELEHLDCARNLFFSQQALPYLIDGVL